MFENENIYKPAGHERTRYELLVMKLSLPEEAASIFGLLWHASYGVSEFASRRPSLLKNA